MTTTRYRFVTVVSFSCDFLDLFLRPEQRSNIGLTSGRRACYIAGNDVTAFVLFRI
jgi:hypothetical protein